MGTDQRPKRSRNELDLRVLRRALNRDEEAFRQLYCCYMQRVHWAVAARIRRIPGQDVEDLVQDVWLYLYSDGGLRRLKRYEPERGPFGRFLELLAANRAFDRVRCLRSEPSMFDELIVGFEDSDLEETMERRDELERLLALMQKELSEDDLVLFCAVYVEGRSVLEVGKKLGVGRAAVYQRHHRLKRQVEKLWRRLLPDDDPPSGSSSMVAVMLALTTLTAASHGLVESEEANAGTARLGSEPEGE